MFSDTGTIRSACSFGSAHTPAHVQCTPSVLVARRTSGQVGGVELVAVGGRGRTGPRLGDPPRDLLVQLRGAHVVGGRSVPEGGGADLPLRLRRLS
ncbi:hypothetical protein ACX28X_11900 [Streptomyces sp. SD18]